MSGSICLSLPGKHAEPGPRKFMRCLTWLCWLVVALEGLLIGIAVMRPLTQGALLFGVLSLAVLVAVPVGLAFRRRWAPFAVLCLGAVFSVYMMHASVTPEIPASQGRYWMEQIEAALRYHSGAPGFWVELAGTGALANLPSVFLFLTRARRNREGRGRFIS